MRIKFDPEKDRLNILKHGVSLGHATRMIVEARKVDRRKDYGEIRYRVFGTIDGVDHCLACTIRDGHIRAISLRRAHATEMRRHVPHRRPRTDH